MAEEWRNINLFQKNNSTIEWKIKNGFSEDDFLILYAGIFGYAQGLEVILDADDRTKDHSDIKFILIGDGPRRKNYLN